MKTAVLLVASVMAALPIGAVSAGESTDEKTYIKNVLQNLYFQLKKNHHQNKLFWEMVVVLWL